MMKAKRRSGHQPQQAATEIIHAAERRHKLAYIPTRWRFVSLLTSLLPEFLYAKIGLIEILAIRDCHATIAVLQI